MAIVYENNIKIKMEEIQTINSALHNGKPIIIIARGDYKIETYNDGLEDHFIVIVGRSVSSDSFGNKVVEYHYFDPRTSKQDKGASHDNVLTLTTDGKLTGTIPGKSDEYTVTSVRSNK
jgi:hypothetical protein